MSKYRINVRFDLDKPKEAKAAQYLQKNQSHFGSKTGCTPRDKKAVFGIVQRKER